MERRRQIVCDFKERAEVRAKGDKGNIFGLKVARQAFKLC